MSKKNSRNSGKLKVPSNVIEMRMEKIHFKGVLTSLIIKILVIALAAFLVFAYVFGIAIQKGEGMYPRIRDGDVMLFYRHPTSLVVGDIITVQKDSKRYTGRIVAKGGDVVSVSTTGNLNVNGAAQHEEIFYETYTQGSPYTYPYTVPQNSYFILGDMRTGSSDSRDIGAIKESEIEGKIITIIRRRGI